jgi:hypothetical protein
MLLSRIVSSPVLRIILSNRFPHCHCFGYRRTAVGVTFTLDHVFNGDNVLAFDAAQLVIWTIAMRFLWINLVTAIARLRRNQPSGTSF